MGKIAELYKPSLALLTDLYELTMAYGYWKLGRTDEQAAFSLSFRRNPFDGGYTIACGLEYAIDIIEGLRFADDDVAYLATLPGNDGKPIFEHKFLDYLAKMELQVDVDAPPEGTVMFPHEPILRICGPLIQCQILETALLNVLNFQSLIATKASRVCRAARGEPVVEFGLRRAQGIDGALAASRAAYIGGCSATSNVLAGRLFGIPVKGTHAHSWVMSFDSEIEAFNAYAKAMPNNCIFLVDTYNTIEGVKNAIKAGRILREQGHEMVGIRLDSGDLAYLSIQARRLLDDAGFPDAKIVASNNLDEDVIESLKEQQAAINLWGVGTRLVAAYGQPALGGVYKLTAMRDRNQDWQYKIKLSEQKAKINIPGILQVRRFSNDEGLVADMIFDEPLGADRATTIVDPLDETRRRDIPRRCRHEDLLVPVFRNGKKVYESPGIDQAQKLAAQQLRRLHPGIKRMLNPHEYPVGLEKSLFELRQNLILKARGYE